MSAYSIVYLAEKHSIAEALADVLPGRSVKRNGYIECGSAAVTWLSGHLLEQAPPEAYDPAYKRWSRETLPIVPEVFKYTVRRDRNIPKQLAVIKNLLRESPSAVNAADFDREGQLLVDEVLELVRYKGQVLRLKTRALDRTSLTRELGRMAPDGEFAGMRDAARARSELDWLAGMNLTRAMTIHGRSVCPSGVLSLGRVQTPTLALVVERDETIENFVPKTFYKVSCPFTAAAGTFVTLLNPRPDMEGLDEEKRLVDKKTALAVRDAVSFGDGTVTGVETQRRADPAPLPYSLTDIQKEASALYGMGASAVLDCCQELYEARFTSYPRTDCRYLPFEQFGEARDVLAAIGHLPGMEAMLAAADPERRGACWNTARVTAHHAIIPTAVPARGLSETQEKIYRLICRRYVWQFLPPHIYKKTRIDVSCAGYDWRADGRTEVSPGWYAFRKAGLSGGTKEKETKEPEPAPLPHVEKGEAVRAGQAKVDEGQTTPPARFTEGTLVEAMENIQRYLRGASGEDRDILRKTEGLGTVATRATIISTLLKRGYLAKKGRSLLSTPTGRSLIHICPQSIRDPLMTADMERSLTEIQEGRIPYKNYVASYTAKLPELISEIFGTPADGFAADPGTLCPRCGKPLKRVRGKTGRWFWLCTGRPDCTHEFKTPLSSIEGYAMLLQDESLSAEARSEYTERIVVSTRRLSTLVSNILMITKIENQTMPFALSSYRVDEQVRQSILLLENKWSEKNIGFEMDMDSIEFCAVEGLLGNVWSNLIDNAIKFSPEGEIIYISLKEKDDMLSFKIANRGEPMSGETLKRIFEKFYQGDTSHKREGNGLGLALVKKIVRVHGGSVSAVNTEDGLIEFTVNLPAKRSCERCCGSN